MTSNGEPYHRARYKAIIQEQVLLGYLTKGGVTYSDTEDMSPHERKLALDAIKEILEGQSTAQRQVLQQHQSSNDPKSGLTSGIK